jgi:hypothetical protein
MDRVGLHFAEGRPGWIAAFSRDFRRRHAVIAFRYCTLNGYTRAPRSAGADRFLAERDGRLGRPGAPLMRVAMHPIFQSP